ncbi:hypothetical protein CQ13_09565 [Bradyrhizobium retamae]|uniref:Uncharacterized protein n=1 Tax=Bradyrhizobium retamae TaxID=1300035 RepID=A0A0R3MEJ7_9BRAD|nr:hypothetical protein CQ13_09565 [Bradyrhizobium retamae]
MIGSADDSQELNLMLILDDRVIAELLFAKEPSQNMGTHHFQSLRRRCKGEAGDDIEQNDLIAPGRCRIREARKSEEIRKMW